METIRFTHEYEFESRDTNHNIINKIEPFFVSGCKFFN